MKRRNFILVVVLLLCSVFCLVGCTGPQGEQGIQGAKGETGAPGKNGIDGEQGPQGEKGDTGSQGEQGEKGPQGEKGDKGDKGDDGKAVEFSVDAEGLKWRYQGEETWKELVSFEDIEGYKSKYTVTFNVDGGSAVDNMKDVEYKTEIDLPTPTKDNYTFKGWSDGTETHTGKYVVKGNVTLTAVWEAVVA